MLFRHEIALGLGAHQVALSRKTTRADGDLALVSIESHSLVVFHQLERREDPLPLVFLEHVFPYRKVQHGVYPQYEYRRNCQSSDASPMPPQAVYSRQQSRSAYHRIDIHRAHLVKRQEHIGNEDHGRKNPHHEIYPRRSRHVQH